MAIDFRSDPMGQRIKGWKVPPYSPRTRLVPGWEPRPEYGAGQAADEVDQALADERLQEAMNLYRALSEPVLRPESAPEIDLSPLPPSPGPSRSRDPSLNQSRPAPDEDQTPSPEPPAEPIDWGAARQGMFGPSPLGPPPPPDPDLTRHLGGTVAPPSTPVYAPSQARTLSTGTPTPAHRPPAQPPTVSQSASAAVAPGGAGPRTTSQQAFIDQLLPAAQEMGRKTGIPWQVLVAIPANETGWGQSVFHNNYFGIKDPNGPQSPTWEVVNGQRVNTNAGFAAFNSPEASMQGFAQLMSNSRYAPAMAALQKDPSNWPLFVSMIHSAGYATDPAWAQKVISIGQRLESSDNQPHTTLSTVANPSGSVVDTAQSAVGDRHPAGGTQVSASVFPVQGFQGKVSDHWGSVKGGSDLFAPRGTPVVAMRGGTVVESGWNSIGGNAVLIKGDDGLEYYYAHGDASPSVKAGTHVDAGTFLMPVGDTGDAKGKGTHLHIGIGPDIKLGSDKYGGTGGDYDAVGMLNSALSGKPATATKQDFTSDASFVAWSYRNGLGKNLPATTGGLYVASKPISADDAQPGDLVMFNMNSRDPNQQHVAIYAGNGEMIHNTGGRVERAPMWSGGEFRRLSGVKTKTPPVAANPIVRYTWNADGTYTALHADGTTTQERNRTEIAPVVGGPHPSTYGAHPSTRMGGGQDDSSYDIPVLGGLKRGAEAAIDPLTQAMQELDPLKRQYPVMGPGGLGLYDPRIGAPPEEGTKPDFSDADSSAGIGLTKSMSTHPEDPGTYGGTPGYTTSRPSDVWRPPPKLSIDTYTPPQGVTDQDIAQALRDHAEGRIDRHQLEIELGTSDIESVRDYALDRALAGDRTLAESMPASLLHQMRGRNVNEPLAVDLRNRARLGQGSLEERSPYKSAFTDPTAPNGWKPEKGTTIGDGLETAKGEVHAKGVYFDAFATQARRRFQGDKDLYTELRTIRPGALDKDQVLNLRDDPNAAKVMDDAHTWATNEYNNRGWSADWGGLIQQYLLDRGYKLVYGGGLGNEAGEVVVLDPNVDAYTQVVDTGPSQEMIARAHKLPGFDPHMLSGLLIGTFVGAAGAAAKQGQQQQVVAPSEMGTGNEGKPTMSKKEASYTKRATEDHCQDCSMFRSNACTLVKGYIHNRGSCDYYEPKAGAGQEEDGGLSEEEQRILATPGMGYQPPTTSQALDAIEQAQYTQSQSDIDAETRFLQRQQIQPTPDTTAQDLSDIDAETRFLQSQQPGRAARLPQSTPPIEDIPVIGGVARGFRDVGTALNQIPGVAMPQRPATPLDPEADAALAERQRQIANRMLPTATGVPARDTVTRPQPLTPAPQTSAEEMQRQQALAQGAARTGAVLASLAVPGVMGATLPSALTTGVAGSALTGGTMAAVQQAPDIAQALASGDPEKLKEQAATVAAGSVLGGAPGLAGKALGVAGAGAPLVKAIAQSPVGHFLTSETAAGPALNVFGKPVVGTAAGTVLGAVAGGAPDLLHPDPTNPNWWAQFNQDWVTGAKVGTEIGGGLTLAKTLADRTITPPVAYALNWIFNPRMNIPNTAVQIAASTRGKAIGEAQTAARILDEQGRFLLGKAGKGLNTLEAAAYIEKNRTLAGFVSKDGIIPNVDQIRWIEQEVAREDADQAALTAANILDSSQNVVTPTGVAGPKVHIVHMYEPDVTAAKARAGGGRGLGWRDNMITHGRAKTIDPRAADPNVPRTLDEAIAAYNAGSAPKPLDDLVTRFSTSAYQTKRALANRQFYDTALAASTPGAPDAVILASGAAPQGWRQASREWGFGMGAENMRFEPRLARYMDNLVGIGKGQTWEPVDWLGRNIAAPLKQLTFLGTPVHASNVTWRVLSAMPSPMAAARVIGSYIIPTIRNGYGELLRGNSSLALDAAAHGVTPPRFASEGYEAGGSLLGNLARTGVAGIGGFGAGWSQAKLRGQSDEEAFKEGLLGAAPGMAMGMPGGGKVLATLVGKGGDVGAATNMAEILHRAIFQEGMPAAKLGMYDVLTRAGVDKDIAAEMVNNTVGGIDYATMGRAPWVQDLLRYGVIAPDWTEGIIRTAASAAMPGELGNLTRGTVVRNLAAYMGFIEAMNIWSTGHPTWENPHGREFQLDATGFLDGLAGATGDASLRSRDPIGQGQMNSYLDPLPPLRGVMELVSTLGREAAYTQGQLEYLQGDQAAGQRMMDRYGGNLAQGEVPGTEAAAKLGEEVRSRLHPILGFAGALRELQQGEQKSFSGEPLEKPDLNTASGWATLIGRAVTPLAPAVSQNVLQNVDLAQPWRMHPRDALAEFLGFTRVNRDTELSRNLDAQKRILGWLGLSPQETTLLRENRQADIDANEQSRADAFSSYERGELTSVQLDNRIHELMDERKVSSQRNQVEKLTNMAPAWAQDTLRHMLQGVYDVEGSPLPADVQNTSDITQLASSYWSPPNVDPTNKTALNQARNNLINQYAVAHNEDPRAVEDLLKWNAQHQGDLQQADLAPPPIPNLDSGHLGRIATGYLQSAQDASGKYIQDPDTRGDKMRDYLRTQADALGVKPEVLLQRINLRLSSLNVGTQTPLQRSYDAALQTFFESRDPDRFPRYINADGSPLGTRDDWDNWDNVIADANKTYQGKAKYMPEFRTKALAQERGSNLREKYLIGGGNTGNYNNTDYERWFGFGRNMTAPEWKDYSTGVTKGYTDLTRDARLNPPLTETIHRDKIQELYRASNQDERIHTPVTVWIAGKNVRMPLIGAYMYTRHFMKNTAGRKLEYLAAHDDPEPDKAPSLPQEEGVPSPPQSEESTVGATDAEQ